MFKKILLAILTLNILFLSVLTPVAHAQASPWYNQGVYDWYEKVYDEDVSPPAEIFGERYTAAQVNWIIWSILTWPLTRILDTDLTACILGYFFDDTVDVGSCLEAVGVGSKEIVEPSKYLALENKQSQKSLLSSVFEERSFSGITYVKDIARKFRLIPEAKAQGFGFTEALQPFQGVWRVSRDISYALFILAAIILSFMVMFRVKLSPQTAITVQSAIPKLVIAIILVTFSYAIAGFLVDLMYVVIGILSVVGSQMVSAIISAASGGTIGVTPNPAALFDFLTTGEIPGIGVPLGFVGILVNFTIIFLATMLIVFVTSFGLLATAITGFLGILLIAGIFATGIGGGILLIVLLVVVVLALILLLWMGFKIFWTLLKAFVNIILLTIFAPFMLVLGIVVPAIGFGTWVKSFISNLAVFVVAGFLILLSHVFIALSLEEAFRPYLGGVGAAFFNALFGTAIGAFTGGGITAGWPPLLVTSSGGLAFMYLILSAVFFFMIPSSAELIKSLISGRPFSYGTAIGEALAPSVGLGKVGGLYGAGWVIERGEARATALGKAAPLWTEVGRRVLGLKK